MVLYFQFNVLSFNFNATYGIEMFLRLTININAIYGRLFTSNYIVL